MIGKSEIERDSKKGQVLLCSYMCLKERKGLDLFQCIRVYAQTQPGCASFKTAEEERAKII